MSLASLKRKIEVGTKLKLVRHDWLKPLVVNGNLGQSVMKPNLAIGDVRMVTVKQGSAIAMKSLRTVNDSWLYWPEAKSVRETENGFEVDLEHTGKFEYAMGYEFVASNEEALTKLEHAISYLVRCEGTTHEAINSACDYLYAAHKAVGPTGQTPFWEA